MLCRLGQELQSRAMGHRHPVYRRQIAQAAVVNRDVQIFRIHELRQIGANREIHRRLVELGEPKSLGNHARAERHGEAVLSIMARHHAAKDEHDRSR